MTPAEIAVNRKLVNSVLVTRKNAKHKKRNAYKRRDKHQNRIV